MKGCVVMSEVYKQLVKQLNVLKESGLNSLKVWKVIRVQQQQGVKGNEIIWLQNREGTTMYMPLNALIERVKGCECYITNPSVLQQRCLLFKEENKAKDNVIIVRLTLSASDVEEMDYLKIKTPDNKAKKEIESVLYEIDKKATSFCSIKSSRELSALSKEERCLYNLLQVDGYSIDFFIDYMVKVLGWEVDYIDFDLNVVFN